MVNTLQIKHIRQSKLDKNHFAKFNALNNSSQWFWDEVMWQEVNESFWP